VLNAEEKLRGDEHHDQGDDDESKRLHPAWRAGGRNPLGSDVRASGVAGFGVAAQFSHVDVLLRGSSSMCDRILRETWHDRQIAGHLDHVARLRDQAGDAGGR
jgi:hypothetical protein